MKFSKCSYVIYRSIVAFFSDRELRAKFKAKIENIKLQEEILQLPQAFQYNPILLLI